MLFLSRFSVLTTRLPDPNQCLGTDVICAPEHSTLMAARSCTHEQPTGSDRWQLSSTTSVTAASGAGDDWVHAATPTSSVQQTHRNISVNQPVNPSVSQWTCRWRVVSAKWPRTGNLLTTMILPVNYPIANYCQLEGPSDVNHAHLSDCLSIRGQLLHIT